jgi:hypothetical protein
VVDNPTENKPMKSLFRIKSSVVCATAAWALLSATANATVFNFATDPFAGTTALATPGRQVIGAEDFVNFSVASDVFAVDSSVFRIAHNIQFASGVAGALPTRRLNVIVLQSLDDDGNPATPFGAGNAANLISAKITKSGPGFFIYFNQGLNLPRLVYSTDLSDNTADLKIVARMVNLTGQVGRDEMARFTAGNFAAIFEPVVDQRAPEVPAGIAVPLGHRVHFHGFARGVQIYTWNGADWGTAVPRATLYDDEGNIVASHSAGPAWTSNSGSQVVGALPPKAAIVDPDSIAWLLLAAVPTLTHGPGILADTSLIHRVNTVGGKAPLVNGTFVGQIAEVPYTAGYFFYRKTNQAIE